MVIFFETHYVSVCFIIIRTAVVSLLYFLPIELLHTVGGADMGGATVAC